MVWFELGTKRTHGWLARDNSNILSLKYYYYNPMHFLSNPTLCTWCRMYLPMCQETFGVWREIAFAWIHKWGPLDRDEVGQKKILEGPLDELPYTNAVMRGEPMKCLLVNFLFGSLGKSCWAKKQKLWQKCLSSPSENSSIYLINCMRMNIVVVSRYFGIHFNTFLEKVCDSWTRHQTIYVQIYT